MPSVVGILWAKQLNAAKNKKPKANAFLILFKLINGY